MDGLITGIEKVLRSLMYSSADKKKKTFCTYWFFLKLQNVLNNQIYFNKLI